MQTPAPAASYSRVVATSATDPNASTLSLAAYTNDSTYNDEWVFHRVLPRSGAEKNMDKDIWEGTYAPARTNCYSYAVNAFYSGVGGTTLVRDFFNDYGSNVTSLDGVYEALRVSASIHGFKIERIEKFQSCPTGYYKVALFLNRVPTDSDTTSNAYHFLRQNSNGVWGHRLGEYSPQEYPGSGEIWRSDANNDIIIDPNECNMNFKSNEGMDWMADYPIFVGYFAINPGSVGQPPSTEL